MATGVIILPVQAAKLPSTSSSAIDAGEMNWRLLYDATGNENATWQFRMPGNYSGAAVADVHYTMNSATSGTVSWGVFVMAVTDGDAADIGTASYATINSTGGITVPATVGILDTCTVNLTNADSVAAEDYVVIKLERQASNTANDTAVGDAEVVALSIEYTTL